MIDNSSPQGETEHRAARDDEAAHAPLSGIEQSVEAILASGALGHSERRARLLRYLVAMEDSGNGNKIKAYSIALDVFGRNEDFDPNTDSIVRVEIGRLRKALRLFYGGNTDANLWNIDINKGTYRPTLTPPTTAERPEKSPARRPPWILVALLIAVALLVLLYFWRREPTENAVAPYPVLRIAVMPFDVSGDHSELEKVAFGLYTELALDLSAYPWIAVVSPLDPDEIDADYALKSHLFWQRDGLHTNSQLISLPDERLVWSKSYSIPTTVADIQDTQRRITGGIANSLGSENGITPDLIVARNARNTQANLDGFICFMSTYQYAHVPTRAEHAQLRDCLENTVEEYPEFGEAWAALGVLYMDETRFGRNPRPGRDAWADARDAIDRGLELAPLRNAPLMAGLVLSVQAPVQDIERAREIGRKLMELFPRHSTTLMLIGSLMSQYFGLWTEGLDLVDQAIELEQTPPSTYYHSHAFFAAMQDDDLAALAATGKLTTTTSETELLLKYLAAARTGKTEMMQEQRTALARKNLTSNADLLRFVKNRRFYDALEASLLSQLQAAFEMETH